MGLVKTVLFSFVVVQVVGFLAFTYWILNLDAQDVNYVDSDGVYFNFPKHGQILNGWFSVTFSPVLLFRHCAGLEYIRPLDLAGLAVFDLLRLMLFLSIRISNLWWHFYGNFSIGKLLGDWVVIPVCDAIINLCDFFMDYSK